MMDNELIKRGRGASVTSASLHNPRTIPANPPLLLLLLLLLLLPRAPKHSSIFNLIHEKPMKLLRVLLIGLNP
jgi:hypothetical protein